jgi:AcrR family transcriptional regulator
MNVPSANQRSAKRRGAKRKGADKRAAANSVDTEKRGRGRPLVDDKRRIILDAALRVFAAKGYHGTAVPDVADAAGVGTGTLYRYFANKEALVNEVYRDAKLRLRAAVMDGVEDPDLVKRDTAEAWFGELWKRLGVFARTEPEAFRFLEMQDHVEYLDVKSRQLELSVLMPLWMAGKRMHSRDANAPVDTLMALLWGAFVGLVKAQRLGYLQLDDKRLAQAGKACWRMLAPDVSRSPSSRSKG